MYPKLKSANPVKPLILKLEYDNGEMREIDMKQFCISDYFKQLEDWNYFQQVKIKGEVVAWPNDQDIAPETLYLESKRVS
jgi:hypothetical protein